MNLFQGFILLMSGIVLIILLTSMIKLHAFLSLFVVSLLLALFIIPFPDIVPSLKKGFGETMSSIGLIIIFGASIGVTLELAGAAKSMASFVLKRVGRQNAPAAISITGFITGLPIFCDSGFIVLSGLNRSLSAKSLVSPVFMSTVLACSLYSVHCLIPPHPGATAAAGILGADLGELILLGIAVAIPASFAGFGWARLLTRRGYQSRMINHPEETPEATPLPPAGRSFLPVLVPLLLISGKALAGLLFPGNNSPWMQFVGFAGDPVIALMTGMILAFTLIPGFNLKTLNHILFTTIEKAGPILIITAAGGIFGAVIKASGTGELAGSFLSATGLGLLIPFLLTFILKTAQGSSTVAIITAASIIGPMLEQLGMSGESDRLLAMLAMGAGSMAVSHANDSYFWVITNFSGIDANDTLKVYSSATIIMGLTAFASVVVLSFFMA